MEQTHDLPILPDNYKQKYSLPSKYDFNIPNTIAKILKHNYKTVALQFPDGFLVYSSILSQIFEAYTGCNIIILCDSTYGACCISDILSLYSSFDLLIHYGHEPVIFESIHKMPTIYVPVTIRFDIANLIEHLKDIFHPTTHIAFVTTIQFAAQLSESKSMLQSHFSNIFIPQVSDQLHPGVILGCTAPILPIEYQTIVSIADGRFHLEGMFFSNLNSLIYQYDPINQTISQQEYDLEKLLSFRHNQIKLAQKANLIGIIISSNGRQGNPKIFNRIEKFLKTKNIKYLIVYSFETFFTDLIRCKDVDAWIQIACPRLSIDWGTNLNKPLLTSYEAEVAFGDKPWSKLYPMDNFLFGGGPWSQYFQLEQL